MSQTPNTAIAVIGIDIGKNSFHVVGQDARGAIVLRQKWSRGQVERGSPIPAHGTAHHPCGARRCPAGPALAQSAGETRCQLCAW
jgi:hypothetical protein